MIATALILCNCILFTANMQCGRPVNCCIAMVNLSAAFFLCWRALQHVRNEEEQRVGRA